VVEVGTARAGLGQQDRLVGGAHERGATLGLGVQRDDAGVRAVLRVQLAHGPDEAHGRLTPVDDGYPAEHPRTLS
jgi:hypothetical protein